MRKLKSIVADAFDEHPLSVDDFDMLPFISEHEDATIKMDANSVEPKKNRLTHKSDSPEQIKQNLKKLAKHHNVDIVDDFEDYTSNKPKKTDGAKSPVRKVK